MSANNLKKEELIVENDALKRKIEELEAERFQEELRSDEYIPLVSLCPYQLSLSTLGFGRGKVFTFKRFGEKKRVIYSDLVLIMENNAGFLESGLFYILDARVVREHGLDSIYEELLTKEQMEKVFGSDSELAIEIYSQAPNRQKKLIESMIVNKIADGVDLNMNVVNNISIISGINLTESANDLKSNRVV